MSSVSESEKKEATQLRVALEQQMDQLRDAHQKQVAALRDEISEKQQLINDIKECVVIAFVSFCFADVFVHLCFQLQSETDTGPTPVASRLRETQGGRGREIE